MFAAACGFSWAPIFDGTQALITSNRERAVKASIEKQIRDLNALARKLPSTPQDELPGIIGSAVKKSEALINAASKVDDRKVISAVNNSLSKLMMVLHLENSDLAKEALKTIRHKRIVIADPSSYRLVDPRFRLRALDRLPPQEVIP